MNPQELAEFHDAKVENFYRTVEILVKGWEHCSFTSLREKQKFEVFLKGLNYLLFDRKIKLETLFEFKIGFGEEVYRGDNHSVERVVSVYFPMYAPKEDASFLKKNASVHLVKIKSRGLLPQDKKYQRVMPAGAGFGVFGLNTLEARFNETKGKDNLIQRKAEEVKPKTDQTKSEIQFAVQRKTLESGSAMWCHRGRVRLHGLHPEHEIRLRVSSERGLKPAEPTH